MCCLCIGPAAAYRPGEPRLFVATRDLWLARCMWSQWSLLLDAANTGHFGAKYGHACPWRRRDPTGTSGFLTAQTCDTWQRSGNEKLSGVCWGGLPTQDTSVHGYALLPRDEVSIWFILPT